jgi:hypothetical protein
LYDVPMRAQELERAEPPLCGRVSGAYTEAVVA